MKRDDLIAELSSDLAPVERPPSPARAASLWLASAWLFVVGVTWALGPFRPGFGDQLASSLQFAGESALGAVVGIAGASLAFVLGVPSPRRGLARPAVVLGLTAAWFGAYVYGLASPALEPSMLGKRPHCFIETLVYSIPSLAFGLILLRRYAVLDRAAAGAVVGAAAAAIPALVMQFACMYDPAHTLALHVSPIPVFAALGAVIAARVLPKI